MEDDYLEKAHYYRGKMIDVFNDLEQAINDYIIYHFEPNAPFVNEFNELILNKLTFEQKKLAFKSIVQNKSIANGFVPKSKNDPWPHADLFSGIDSAQQDRNRFAHDYTLETENKDSIIVLAGFKNEYTANHYTLDKFNLLITKVRGLTSRVHAME